MNSSRPQITLPPYLDLVYGDVYRDADKCARMDTKWSCLWRSFFQYNTLVAALVKEIKTSQKVAQLGLVFGSQINETAMAVGIYGQYDIFDINPLEIKRNNAKYGKIFRNMKIFQKDISRSLPDETYHTVICFMLLSEVPPATRIRIVNNALKMVKPGGKVVFIDWHAPLFYHPLRYLVRMYNRLRHPFVERLWERGIESYVQAEVRAQFSWRKSTYFGRMFQKLVATRKELPDSEDTSADDDFFEGRAFDLDAF
jgi:SAM-dependent methyltransferase